MGARQRAPISTARSNARRAERRGFCRFAALLEIGPVAGPDLHASLSLEYDFTPAALSAGTPEVYARPNRRGVRSGCTPVLNVILGGQRPRHVGRNRRARCRPGGIA